MNEKRVIFNFQFTISGVNALLGFVHTPMVELLYEETGEIVVKEAISIGIAICRIDIIF